MGFQAISFQSSLALLAMWQKTALEGSAEGANADCSTKTNQVG